MVIRQLLLLAVFNEAQLLHRLLFKVVISVDHESYQALNVELLLDFISDILLHESEDRVVVAEGERELVLAELCRDIHFEAFFDVHYEELLLQVNLLHDGANEGDAAHHLQPDDQLDLANDDLLEVPLKLRLDKLLIVLLAQRGPSSDVVKNIEALVFIGDLLDLVHEFVSFLEVDALRSDYPVFLVGYVLDALLLVFHELHDTELPSEHLVALVRIVELDHFSEEGLEVAAHQFFEHLLFFLGYAVALLVSENPKSLILPIIIIDSGRKQLEDRHPLLQGHEADLRSDPQQQEPEVHLAEQLLLVGLHYAMLNALRDELLPLLTLVIYEALLIHSR
mmetsp:Transcript_32321/g.49475  ORF Transcript_32321/g.49475 Transcript_32321/m.49475 type:complete len:337 (-) Transcript_32321:804-1814(-)